MSASTNAVKIELPNGTDIHTEKFVPTGTITVIPNFFSSSIILLPKKPKKHIDKVLRKIGC